jgi:hypothetical protein
MTPTEPEGGAATEANGITDEIIVEITQGEVLPEDDPED